MLTDREILSVLEMLKSENLDVRTVTLGISLLDCASDDIGRFKDNIYKKITRTAGDLVDVCDQTGDKYGIPVVNKRLSVSPIAAAAAPFASDQMVRVAMAMDETAKKMRVDFIGGFGALVEKGLARGDLALIEAIPEALSETKRVCASVNVASTRAGINMDAVRLMGRVIKEAAERSADQDGLACRHLLPAFAASQIQARKLAGAVIGGPALRGRAGEWSHPGKERFAGLHNM